MSGLVLELQKDALDPTVNVSVLLRKALVVSRKLSIADIEVWLNNELNGYSVSSDQIPDYREIKGEVKVFNPYHGFQPLHIQSQPIADELSKRKIGQSVGELDSILEGGSNDLRVPFDQSTKNQIMEWMDYPLEPTLVAQKTSVISILESVRNEVLNWALELESKGVIGDGMSFSKEEKQAASNVTYQVTNNIQNMTNSQLQQDSAGASQTLTVNESGVDNLKEFIEQFNKYSTQLEIDAPLKEELQAEVSTVEVQLNSPKPKPAIINESVKTIRNILEGISGSLIASGLLTVLG
ncbi:AbiTii domain-containing protein [Vibrio crassostreae]|uniref:AbiTii domain-containing protein n=1 Tax=Vibrio crassostreae TaxID=246167 RepID=A0A822N835_9VIBR|nr:hypothetical protein [Vibrio crassostreae]MDH5953011.1 hypothetical protein [Vibrio crassostreae]TCN02750.1 hypothetical protein EDB35_13621 [Vibrio crassostreae]TCN73439.1 hypothetical protein EDB60_102109 [Vibrio crassostreae]TCT50315.1 hypothetical protein EDB42_108139 [Vibrio crassostreae]TCT65126.1 hypothetical protein EDB31_12452 [Vibrio crassostreae]